MSVRTAAFLDRDGVINIDRGYVCREQDFEFVPGVFDGARMLRSLGYCLVVVTNQSGIARGYYAESDFEALTAFMEARFRDEGAPIERTYFCPHHPEAAVARYRLACDCRKPAPGMLLDAARDLGLSLDRSVMFGDRLSDMEAAAAAGVGARVLLATDAAGPAPQAVPALVTGAYRTLAEAAAAMTAVAG